MINPSDCGSKKYTKAEAIDHKFFDPWDLLQKYDFNDVLIISFGWSMSSDELEMLKILRIRRAPKPKQHLRLV